MSQARSSSVPDNGNVSKSTASTSSSSSVEDPSRKKFKSGDMVLALWSGVWYGAKVLEEDVGAHPDTGLQVPCYLIHYSGFSKTYDEYLMEDSLMLRNPGNQAIADAENLRTKIERVAAEERNSVALTHATGLFFSTSPKKAGRPPIDLKVGTPTAGVAKTAIGPTQQASTGTRLSPVKRPSGYVETASTKRANPGLILPKQTAIFPTGTLQAKLYKNPGHQPFPGSASVVASGSGPWNQSVAELQNVLKSISKPPQPLEVSSLQPTVPVPPNSATPPRISMFPVDRANATPPRILINRPDGEVAGKKSTHQSACATVERPWPALQGSKTGEQMNELLPGSVTGAGSSSDSRSGMDSVEREVISVPSSSSSSSGESPPQAENSMEVEYLGSTVGKDGCAGEGNDGSTSDSSPPSTAPIMVSEKDYCSSFFRRTSSYERARFCIEHCGSQEEARDFIRDLNEMLLLPFLLKEREEAAPSNDSSSNDSGISETRVESPELQNSSELGQPEVCVEPSITLGTSGTAAPLLPTGRSELQLGPATVPVISSSPAPLMSAVFFKPDLPSLRSMFPNVAALTPAAVRREKAAVALVADLVNPPDLSSLKTQLLASVSLETFGTVDAKRPSVVRSKTPAAGTRRLVLVKAGSLIEGTASVSIRPEPASLPQIVQEPATSVPPDISSPTILRPVRSHSLPPKSTVEVVEDDDHNEDVEMPATLFPCTEPGCRYTAPETLRALNLEIGKIHTHRAKTISGTYMWRADVKEIDCIWALRMDAGSLEEGPSHGTPIENHEANSVDADPSGTLSGTSAVPIKSALRQTVAVNSRRIWFCEDVNEINVYEGEDKANDEEADEENDDELPEAGEKRKNFCSEEPRKKIKPGVSNHEDEGESEMDKDDMGDVIGPAVEWDVDESGTAAVHESCSMKSLDDDCWCMPTRNKRICVGYCAASGQDATLGNEACQLSIQWKVQFCF